MDRIQTLTLNDHVVVVGSFALMVSLLFLVSRRQAEAAGGKEAEAAGRELLRLLVERIRKPSTTWLEGVWWASAGVVLVFGQGLFLGALIVSLGAVTSGACNALTDIPGASIHDLVAREVYAYPGPSLTSQCTDHRPLVPLEGAFPPDYSSAERRRWERITYGVALERAYREHDKDAPAEARDSVRVMLNHVRITRGIAAWCAIGTLLALLNASRRRWLFGPAALSFVLTWVVALGCAARGDGAHAWTAEVVAMAAWLGAIVAVACSDWTRRRFARGFAIAYCFLGVAASVGWVGSERSQHSEMRAIAVAGAMERECR